MNKQYWLCCGSLSQDHKDSRGQKCREAETGHPERCQFGTAEDHGKWERAQNESAYVSIDREELARLRADSAELARVRGVTVISKIMIETADAARIASHLAGNQVNLDPSKHYRIDVVMLGEPAEIKQSIPEGFALVPVEQVKDSERLAFMLTDFRKVVVESLMGSRYAVYVEEGFMADRQYPSVRLTGEWKDGSPGALHAKRRAIDLAMLAAAQKGDIHE